MFMRNFGWQRLALIMLLMLLGGCSGNADLLGPGDGGNDGGNNGGGGGGEEKQISVTLTCWPAPFVVGQLMTFDATASWSNDEPLHFDWDFDGDGSFEVTGGSAKTEDYTPHAAGSFVARVRATDAKARTAEATKAYTVTDDIDGGNGGPKLLDVALTIWPSPFRVGQDATFDASNAWSNDEPIKFDWDFDGDGTWDISGGSENTVTRKPDKEGDFIARVRITDAKGRTAEAQHAYKVEAEDSGGGSYDPEGPPVAQIGAWPTAGNAPLDVHIDSRGSWSKDGKKLTKYEYDLDGDGSFETTKPNGNEFVHTFTTAGTFEIATRVTSPNGKTATDSKTITVSPAPPGGGGNGGGGGDDDPVDPLDLHFDPVAVLIASDVLVNVGDEVSFDGHNSIDPLGQITLFEWDMDGDGVFELSGPNLTSQTYTFSEAGIHIVTLRVTDDEGNQAEYPAYIIVQESGAP